jgi:hypothetical protein
MTVTVVIGIYNICKLQMEITEKSVFVLPVIVLFIAASIYFCKLIFGNL